MMKKIFVSLIVIIAIVSCSKEDSNNYVTEKSTDLEYTNLFSRSSSNSVAIRMKVKFDEIMLSNEYIQYQINLKNLIDKIYNAGRPPIESRLNFENWIQINIGNTKFNNVAEAMSLYDNTVHSAEVYYNSIDLFFEDLIQLNSEDMSFVLGDGLGNIPQATTTSNPCQNGCMDSVGSAIDKLDNDYMIALSQVGFIGRFFLDYRYWEDYQGLIDSFNDCMGGC